MNKNFNKYEVFLPETQFIRDSGKKISDSIKRCAKKLDDKVPCDQTYRVKILGVNDEFADIVPIEEQIRIIKEYHIPVSQKSTSAAGYYTVDID